MDRRSMTVAGEPQTVTRNGRRYFSKAHKDAVVAKCLVPGASLAAVALANGFNANLVRRWVREHQLRESGSRAKLLPVTLEQKVLQPASPGALPIAPQCPQPGSIEVRIGRIELVLRGQVDPEQLQVVLATLLRSR